jgi:hypothetical protein
VNAEVQAPPGFRVEVFASTTAYGMAFGPGGAFGTDLYVSTGTAIERIATDGTPSTFATGLVSANGIAFSNDDAFDLYLYVVDDGVNEVQRIDSTGQKSTFASIAGGSAVDLNDLVFGSGMNGFSANLFVSDGGHHGTVAGKIHEVAPDGAVSLFFGTDPLTAAGITFAAGSGFGPSALILADSLNHSTDDGGVRSYDASGAFRTIIDARTSILYDPSDVVQGPGGTFGRDLFLTDWNRDALYTLTAGGDLSEFASGFSFALWRDADILFSPDGSALYVSDAGAGVIYRIAPGFPPQGDDRTSSLGLFEIVVREEFEPLLDEFPGYDPDANTLRSPTLFDRDTIIGRSEPHEDGSPADEGGTAVGTAGTAVADVDFVLRRDGFEGPPGTREVHTEIRRLTMTDDRLGIAIRAGTGWDLRASPGEVESRSGASGDPNRDFPAQSFFNVFVEVDIPLLGGTPLATLYNEEPLLVESDDLTGFPPRVLYTHGNSSPVPVLFREDNLGTWNAGDVFGWMVLAGHGVDFDIDVPEDVADFEQRASELPRMCPADLNGDTNGDGQRDIADAVYLLSWLFLGTPAPVEMSCEFPLPCPPEEQLLVLNGDVNGDRQRDMSDALHLLGWLFLHGSRPVPICSCPSGPVCAGG